MRLLIQGTQATWWAMSERPMCNRIPVKSRCCAAANCTGSTLVTGNSGIGSLARAGIPIWIDHSARIAHSKSMILDGTATLTGSMNWTGGAALNSENLNLIASRTIAAAYAGHWHQRLALSRPYTQREEWCRRPEMADFKSDLQPR